MRRIIPLFTILLILSACNGRETEDIKSYVVMVSMDGFRWDYQDLYDTPNLDALEEEGVKAAYLLPSFPTKTFPNHYTIATGLYPDHNGIINNTFYADDLGEMYRMGSKKMVTCGDAYFGEPIWVTAETQGQKAASFFWVGSEAPVKGVYPSYWKNYDESIPYEDRVDQVIDWLKLPMNKRPSLVTLYFDEPDGVGHDEGPESPETEEVIHHLDALLGVLRSELGKLDIHDRINLIVLSDHGMGAISDDRYVNLKKHLPEHWIDDYYGGNPVYLIDPAEGMEDSICLRLNSVEGVSAWKGGDIPEHLHYGTSPRFPGIVAVADSLWSIGLKDIIEAGDYSGGTHGYDNRFSQMRTIFFADGPAFKSGYSRPSFENVEVYGIIAHILGLEPADTDGNLDHVSDIFVSE